MATILLHEPAWTEITARHEPPITVFYLSTGRRASPSGARHYQFPAARRVVFARRRGTCPGHCISRSPSLKWNLASSVGCPLLQNIYWKVLHCLWCICDSWQQSSQGRRRY